MKKLICLIMCVCLVLMGAPVSAQKEIAVELDGCKLDFDVSPVNIEGRVLVPVRTIFESMGATVEWDETAKKVTSNLLGTRVIMKINKDTMMVNSKRVYLDVPAKLIGGRTMVPARAVAESFGADVFWEAETDTVKIFTKEYKRRVNNMQEHSSTKLLSADENIRSEFRISHFEEYGVLLDTPDGTEFEIISSGNDYFSLLNIRSDIYRGPEHPMTEQYANSVAGGMVSIVSGELISATISTVGDEEVIKIHYTIPSGEGSVSDVLVYMGIKNGVVYTLTYKTTGNVPKRIKADMDYMIDTFRIY